MQWRAAACVLASVVALLAAALRWWPGADLGLGLVVAAIWCSATLVPAPTRDGAQAGTLLLAALPLLAAGWVLGVGPAPTLLGVLSSALLLALCWAAAVYAARGGQRAALRHAWVVASLYLGAPVLWVCVEWGGAPHTGAAPAWLQWVSQLSPLYALLAAAVGHAQHVGWALLAPLVLCLCTQREAA
jgi:hypothetical protein